MRQVPQKNTYLIIGSGRLASHLIQYFKLLNISVLKWSRNANPDFNSFSNTSTQERLQLCLKMCSHVLLAISDEALETWINDLLPKKRIIHFSGTYYNHKAFGIHPLMTFTKKLLNLEFYQNIPMVTDYDPNTPTLGHLIPEWLNPYFYLPSHKKRLYHSLCVLSGNFTNLLWQRTFQLFENELQLPKETLHYYLKMTCTNILEDPYNSLTGPLVRQDKNTMIENQNALKDYRLDSLYEEFVKVYQNNFHGENNK